VLPCSGETGEGEELEARLPARFHGYPQLLLRPFNSDFVLIHESRIMQFVSYTVIHIRVVFLDLIGRPVAPANIALDEADFDFAVLHALHPECAYAETFAVGVDCLGESNVVLIYIANLNHSVAVITYSRPVSVLVGIQMYIEFGLNTLLCKLLGDKLPDFEQVLGIL
jgi:hypothetical protein